MKNLIYFFLLCSSIVFSQNFNYAIEEPKKITLPTLPVVNNQLEEIEYFKAYVLPVSQKYNLQKALDTYGAVRLEKGDYSGVNIVMKSNQRLYGHPTASQVSNVTIAAGSNNVVLESLNLIGKNIIFQSGGIISNCTIKSIRYGDIITTNGMVENNTFIDVLTPIRFDCSVSGYFRNNKIIRHQVHSNPNMLIMKGNVTTPSYGNVHLSSNYLTSHGDSTEINGLQSATFVGIDAEGWNLFGTSTKAMFEVKNMGTLKIADFQGGSYNSSVNTAYDIDAEDLTFYNKWLETPNDIISAKTNMFLVRGFGTYNRGAGTQTGYDLIAHKDYANIDVKYNGNIQTTTITNSTDIAKLSNTILTPQYSPWARPIFETLPDPLGANWNTERVGKPDSRAYIQNLIDTNKIAELPEGVFYIGATLNIPLDKEHGIIGKGTGKTVICGLTDNFPLITIGFGNSLNFELSYLTLQGGSVGVLSNIYDVQIAFQNLKYVVFRNQNYGIHLKHIVGLDNAFFNNVSFINCNKGFFQEPVYPYVGVQQTYTYIDKVVFYKNQFINCNEAVSMRSTRASNLDVWVDCKFDNNRVAMNTSGLSSAIIANCDFTNNTGSTPSGSMGIGTYKENAVINGAFSLYSCNFNNNSAAYVFNTKDMFLEGCNLLDNITLFASNEHSEGNYYISNSTVTGTLGRTSIKNGVFVNSNLTSYPAYSKLLVNLKNNIATTIINKTPNPYPQLLVTQ